ncbi:hypothetical protein PPROV_000678300 [Pycnococcus provasolii]|uniref:Uncharacterized protein n=1 Tax=Pycnococcus provasolii TaxID=41880 RepID=A0A830HRH1_9CHLO|nr:hypothetical protein PPROV_000678300 [Pycnococcus provasolii]
MSVSMSFSNFTALFALSPVWKPRTWFSSSEKKKPSLQKNNTVVVKSSSKSSKWIQKGLFKNKSKKTTAVSATTDEVVQDQNQDGSAPMTPPPPASPPSGLMPRSVVSASPTTTTSTTNNQNLDQDEQPGSAAPPCFSLRNFILRSRKKSSRKVRFAENQYFDDSTTSPVDKTRKYSTKMLKKAWEKASKELDFRWVVNVTQRECFTTHKGECDETLERIFHVPYALSQDVVDFIVPWPSYVRKTEAKLNASDAPHDLALKTIVMRNLGRWSPTDVVHRINCYKDLEYLVERYWVWIGECTCIDDDLTATALALKIYGAEKNAVVDKLSRHCISIHANMDFWNQNAGLRTLLRAVDLDEEYHRVTPVKKIKSWKTDDVARCRLNIERIR